MISSKRSFYGVSLMPCTVCGEICHAHTLSEPLPNDPTTYKVIICDVPTYHQGDNYFCSGECSLIWYQKEGKDENT